MRNNYENRIRAAAWVSALLHLLALLLALWLRPAFHFGPSLMEEGPISVTFESPPPVPQPRQQPLERQLVDVAQPASQPVQPTDLIAVQDSNASDTTAAPSSVAGPRVDVMDTLDSLGGRAGAVPTPSAAPEPPTPPAPPSPAQESEAKAPEMAAEPQGEKQPAAPTASQRVAVTMAKAESAGMAAPAAVDAAASPAAPAAPAQTAPPGNDKLQDSPTRGRTRGVQKVGVQGFEALRDQIAPYLKKVEDAVERQWREALLTKYNGARATTAEIDCEIGPDGRIVSLKITGTPDDRIYAALCKEAIEKAGPFGAFPFQVPEMYRNKNLEIRWSFNFL